MEEFARDQAAWAKAFGDVYEKMLGEAHEVDLILDRT